MSDIHETTTPALLDAARKQLATVTASGDAMAFLGWWMAWKAQPGVNPDDLADLVKAAGLDMP